MRTVIFDLDGTLADTGADLIAAANGCFGEIGAGPQLDPVADKSTAFRGGRAMLRLGFERLDEADVDAAVEAQYPRLLELYGENIDTHTVLYPGVAAAIAALRDEGYAVAICTNKPSGLAETLMTRLRARHWFGALVGADTLPLRKPDPAPYFEAVRLAGGDPTRSLLVGDTVTDRETARAAGVPSVLVTFGPEGAGVADLAPEALLPHYDELGGVVRGLIG
ncbi:phosphoglycolate phosphatase [Tranquillimonas rosea]|uniref:phosphoglycolate phosphatase n=1 Tax=Tranquillimonas rosea TaxID=641238 RepID=A0A1H9Q3Z5_9RHOB|nr:HAD-IA family hydrolase [Tranquillimonas rosea]SER55296.1 phosphoglycolate phosphatase [Tranquillimonas rosea]